MMLARTALFAILTACLHAQAPPVLVELFTSEGCSSCPPADALLARLHHDQPIADARIIVLSEHVDYWNRLGWKDPFSSPAFTARQEAYARRFVTDGPYTPQMVVDGKSQFVGSDAGAAAAAIRNASRDDKVAVRLVSAGASLQLDVDPLPKGKHANVYVVYADESATSDVARGENQGRRLHHVSIARDLREVGKVDAREGFHLQLAGPPAGARLIAFVQEPGLGRVWGAAVAGLP